jgi:hypothetical protein
MAYFDKGENYFLPHIVEEKKKLSWTKLTDAILSIAQLKNSEAAIY